MQSSVVRLPLIEHYLREQSRATAVERFARVHDQESLAGKDRYRDLIPVEGLKPGQQLAFQVDLDACTGCKACVTACHRMNGLDGEEAETWRDVGLLQGGSADAPVQQTITTACHHCVDPACMKGCPVNAYEKDPVTGIVRHLDDQCIGCQYCMLTCPYEVPQFNRRLGIVRKCDMCAGRLAAGEATACVQACPNEAISIRVVNTAEVVEEAQAGGFLPGAAPPAITIPTTNYVSRRPLPRNMLPADFYRVRSSNAHWALAIMLVLTQFSVGMFLADFLLASAIGAPFGSRWPAYRGVLAAFVGVLALVASVFHLGRPKYALRALIGLRTSWLSREILMFGLFAVFALADAAISIAPPILRRDIEATPAAVSVLQMLVLGTGALGVLCSVMLYAATQKQLWTFGRTSFRFGSTVLLAAGSSALTMGLTEELTGAATIGAHAKRIALALALLGGTKLLWELGALVHLRAKSLGELKRSAILLAGELRGAFVFRFVLGAMGGVVFPLVLSALLGSGPVSPSHAVVAAMGVACIVGGELVERSLFFRSVSVPTMPGGIGR
ncbi:MAG TPA: DmsC/YnfH family molybdoenzyme membrane anchor subunit [Polyangiaceae bacterium]